MMHRPAVLLSILVASGVAACAGPARSAALATVPAAREAPPATFQAPAGPAPSAAAPTGFADVNTDASLISNGSVTASSPELLSTAGAFRREVYRLGGRVFAEQVHFRAEPDDDGKQASTASYRIKLLPRLLPDLLDWLGKHAAITAQDVQSILAMESEGDASIVRADVQARIAAIDAQLADPAVDPVRDPASRAALETERTRLTGAAIADPSAMADNARRVAVLEVRLEAPAPYDPYARGQLLGHARGSVLGLGVLGQATHHRVGAGVGLGIRSPVAALEIMGYAAPTMNERTGVAVTGGIGGYSRALGAGNRGSFNPYAGVRYGYAYLEAHYFVIAAELGMELVKQHGVLWTVSARPTGLIGSSSQAAVEIGSSLALAF